MNEYAATAKELGIKYRVWKWGIDFGRLIQPGGKKYGMKLVHIIPLTGWITDPHKIVEAIANDPDWRIRYADTQGNNAATSTAQTPTKTHSSKL